MVFQSLIICVSLLAFGYAADFEEMKFSQTYGPEINLFDDDTLAERYEGECFSVCFSDRQLKPNQKLRFNITETEPGWLSSLNVGIIYKSPDSFLPGSLVLCDATSIPETKVFIFERFYSEENIYDFWVDSEGSAFLTPNVTSDNIVFNGVNVHRQFWVIFNIMGVTKAVKLLSVEQ